MNALTREDVFHGLYKDVRADVLNAAGPDSRFFRYLRPRPVYAMWRRVSRENW